MNDELEFKDVGGREIIADTQAREMMNSKLKWSQTGWMDSEVAVEIESIGFGDRFGMMKEGEGRSENEADVSNFGGQVNCYNIHQDKVNIEEQVLVREDNEFSHRRVKFEVPKGNPRRQVQWGEFQSRRFCGFIFLVTPLPHSTQKQLNTKRKTEIWLFSQMR